MTHSLKIRRFLICCSFAPSLIRFRGDLLDSCLAKGVDIIAVAPSFDEETLLWCKKRNIITETIPLQSQGLNVFKDLKSMASLFKVIKKHKPDVTMGYTHKPALYTAYMSFLAGVKHRTMMVTGLGFGFEPGPSKFAKILPIITRNMFRIGSFCCHKVIFHNKDNRDYFLKDRLTLSANKTIVVGGSGVHVQNFSFSPLRKKDPNKLTFLLIARLVRYKGILEFAKAAEKLKQDYPQAVFRLIGYRDKSPIGYSAEEFEFISAQLEFLGRRDDIHDQIKETDIYVLPSYGEGLPRTVLEAMATGRAIITSDTYGCRSTVDEAENGILIQPRDWKSLEKGLSRFLSGELDPISMGKLSRKKVLEEFDVKIVNHQMMTALNILKENDKLISSSTTISQL